MPHGFCLSHSKPVEEETALPLSYRCARCGGFKPSQNQKASRDLGKHVACSQSLGQETSSPGFRTTKLDRLVTLSSNNGFRVYFFSQVNPGWSLRVNTNKPLIPCGICTEVASHGIRIFQDQELKECKCKPCTISKPWVPQHFLGREEFDSKLQPCKSCPSLRGVSQHLIS